MYLNLNKRKDQEKTSDQYGHSILVQQNCTSSEVACSGERNTRSIKCNRTEGSKLDESILLICEQVTKLSLADGDFLKDKLNGPKSRFSKHTIFSDATHLSNQTSVH